MASKDVSKESEKLSPNTFSDLFPQNDVFYFSGEINYIAAKDWRRLVTAKPNRMKSVTVFFCSCGGSPDAAFRMMRILQNIYDKITVIIFGECYSAATLFVLGADRIIMGYDAQLGPLDIQLLKEDELSRISGECFRQALLSLNAMSNAAFCDHFRKVKSGVGFPLSTATASRIASEITIGLFAPITQKIDPEKLGEFVRAQAIGVHYGLRLMKERYNYSDAQTIVMNLAYNYPSHSTVIDYKEAASMKLKVEKFDDYPELVEKLSKLQEDMLEQQKIPVMEDFTQKTIPQ